MPLPARTHPSLAAAFTKGQDQPVAVPNDQLALPVSPFLGPFEDVGSASTELRSQIIQSGNPEVRVVGTCGSAGS
jgi:hypothetical protein